ncbi:MAG: hypothetical protein Q8L41_00260 [Anaerolineales bacterium]|nr:hypothetical protein [Anaerolineales bacterium]
MAAIALLVVGAMGAISMKAFAKGSQAPVTQADACAQDQADGTEVASATDTDTVELQCGEQVEDGQPDGAADTDNVQEEVGNQSGPDTGVEAPEVEAPAAP